MNLVGSHRDTVSSFHAVVALLSLALLTGCASNSPNALQKYQPPPAGAAAAIIDVGKHGQAWSVDGALHAMRRGERAAAGVACGRAAWQRSTARIHVDLYAGMSALMNLLNAIEGAWSWVGINPSEVMGDNAFGNLIVSDVDGRYWCLCPEELSCSLIARTRQELDALTATQAFHDGWDMAALVKLARATCGPLGPGRKYCLKISGPLGGTYEAGNIGTIFHDELVRASGDVARQIKDVPDDGKVQLVVTL